ncbi:MAG: alpha-D-ribose 1-methylphosphonate 5-triphosphate diphosphatase [Candidatus Latescibacterota bacterium]
MKRTILTNTHVVTPDADFDGAVVIEDGKIAEVVPRGQYREGIDLKGSWLIPGLIDLHSDYLEREIKPRPTASFPLSMALHHADMRAIGSGLTTVVSCARFSSDGDKNSALGTDCITGSKDVAALQPDCMARHFIQARWDTNFTGAESLLEEMLDLPIVKMVVYNESIPGQRQFRDLDSQAALRSARRGISSDEAKAELEKEIEEKMGLNNRPDVYRMLKGRTLIGSHDDTTVDHVLEAVQYGATLSEMPTTIEAARKAKELGLWVCMGAPNYVRGGSSYNNLSCAEAMAEDLVDALCSDYHYPSMLTAVVMMMQAGMTPSKAVNYVTLGAARCLDMADDYGRIAEGKVADLIAFDVVGQFGKVRQVWVDGQVRFMCPHVGQGIVLESMEAAD